MNLPAQPPVAEVPAPSPEELLTIPPNVKPPVVNPVIKPHANAGKVSLWRRENGYDCAVFLPADYDSNPGKTYPLIAPNESPRGSTTSKLWDQRLLRQIL